MSPLVLTVTAGFSDSASGVLSATAGASSSSSDAGLNSAVLSPSLPITHTFVRQGTSSPSSKKTSRRVPSTLASSSKAALSVS